ncbi:MAG: SRPBCC domain-containing protein [Sphingomonas sp.]|uniref:SRPBCC family protein n=1 Tax=Sphingomonas sp. TaxID=28214 RepID=UPI001B23498E|nr:SRPBCC domain-containing protein [Sphingomonas sp.]MBO9621547.1 SRPBCC domain-containing protein [Sphingomonas sp.]
MNATALLADTHDIVVDEVFPHAPEFIWKALTDGELIGRWLMEPTGFAPEVGRHFTYRTTAAGKWDGTIECEVLEVQPHERLVYSWKGGDAGNVGYGSLLDTVVTWVLQPVDGGTRVRLVHAGFVLPRNESTYRKLAEGWNNVVGKMVGVAVKAAADE